MMIWQLPFPDHSYKSSIDLHLALHKKGRTWRVRPTRIIPRAGRGRSAALEANVSPATLSRVENGNVPDLATFAKICRWLEIDPAQFLGVETRNTEERPAVVHFRKKKTVSTDTAVSLGVLILAAQDALDAHLKILQQQ